MIPVSKRFSVGSDKGQRWPKAVDVRAVKPAHLIEDQVAFPDHVRRLREPRTYGFPSPSQVTLRKIALLGILMGLRVLAVQRFMGFQTWMTAWRSVVGNRELTITILRSVINLAR